MNLPPVVWWSIVDGERPKDKWDAFLLKKLFAAHPWVYGPADGQEDTTGGTGAIVVVPGGVHATPGRSELLRIWLNQLPWAVVLITADEQSLFRPEWLEYDLPHVRVWLQTPGGENLGHPRVFGYAGTHANIPIAAPGWLPPVWDWAWSGQVNNTERQALIGRLEDAPNGMLWTTNGFSQGLDHDTDYRASLARAKVVPCPPGATTVDTFRVWEAIEHGCIPIVQDDPYWQRIANGAGLPTIQQHQWGWTTTRHLISHWAERWPRESNRLWSWWFQERYCLKQRIRQSVLDVGGTWDVDDLAVVITSSPTPENPSTNTIEEVIKSVQARTNVPIWLLLDGVSPRLQDNADAVRDYRLYTNQVLWKAEHDWCGVIPVVYPDWRHQNGMVRSLLNSGAVTASRLLVSEHDSPLQGEIPLDALGSLIDTGTAHVVRLGYAPYIYPEHEHMYIDQEPRLSAWWSDDRGPDPVPYLRTWQWSQQPHLASTAYYHELLRTTSPEPKYIEEVATGVMSSGWVDYGMHSWYNHRVVLYAPEKDGQPDYQRSRHIDDRHGNERYLGREVAE